MTREIHAPDSKIMHLGCRVHSKVWTWKTIKMHNFTHFYTFLHTPSNCYLKMIEMISIVTIFYFDDDFPTFDVLCKSFLYKINHQKKINIFRVGPKIRVGRDT